MIETDAIAQQQVSQVQFRLSAQTAILESVTTEIEGVANTVLRPDLIGTDDRLAPAAQQVLQTFEIVTGLLNTQAAGRSLFAGSAVDQPSLASPEAILSALSALVPQGASASDIVDITAAWFAPGGGFDAFLPSASEPERKITLGEGVAVAVTQQVGSPPLRQVLAILATGSLVALREQEFSPDTQRQVLSGITNDLRGAASALRHQTEKIGADLARSDQALVRIGARQNVAQTTYTEIVAVDPYEVATLLQDRIARLDQILAVTARLSRLSLSNYL